MVNPGENGRRKTGLGKTGLGCVMRLRYILESTNAPVVVKVGQNLDQAMVKFLYLDCFDLLENPPKNVGMEPIVRLST